VEHFQHFGLSQDPFSNEPDLRFYFDSASHKETLLRLDRSLRQGKGLTMLTGEPGTGKTLIARRLFENLEEEVFEVSLMVMLPGATDAQSVLSRFAKQLGAEDPGDDRSAVLGCIYERLAIVREEGRHSLLIIDDAHILGPEVMAEVGGLLNMEYEDRRLLSLLLVGTHELDACMSGDAALLQRVDVRVQLQPLDLDNTAAYLAHRLTIVGGAIPLLPAPTVEALFKFSRGRPRLINTLADNALFEAYLGGATSVGGADVERAAGDLGIGSDPGTTYTQLTPMGAAAIGPAAASPSPPVVSNAPVVGDLSGSDAGPACDTGLGEQLVSNGSSSGDLAALLDSTDELTTVLNLDPDTAGGTVDLDAEVEAVLAEREPDDEQIIDALPIFSAENSAATPLAEQTRIALPDEAAGAGEDDVAELDDLFVELIED